MTKIVDKIPVAQIIVNIYLSILQPAKMGSLISKPQFIFHYSKKAIFLSYSLKSYFFTDPRYTQVIYRHIFSP